MESAYVEKLSAELKHKTSISSSSLPYRLRLLLHEQMRVFKLKLGNGYQCKALYVQNTQTVGAFSKRAYRGLRTAKFTPMGFARI